MKKTKPMLVVIAMLIVVLSGCGTSAPSTIGGSNESQPIESEDENGVPDFVQAMYDEMGELTEMYGLCYEMVKEPAYHQMDTAEHNWCYFEFETEEFLSLIHISSSSHSMCGSISAVRTGLGNR